MNPRYFSKPEKTLTQKIRKCQNLNQKLNKPQNIKPKIGPRWPILSYFLAQNPTNPKTRPEPDGFPKTQCT